MLEEKTIKLTQAAPADESLCKQSRANRESGGRVASFFCKPHDAFRELSAGAIAPQGRGAAGGRAANLAGMKAREKDARGRHRYRRDIFWSWAAVFLGKK